jgi:Flp pilus assembly protein TadD
MQVGREAGMSRTAIHNNKDRKKNHPMIARADILALAARFRRLGAFSQAEQLYRQALEQQPDDAELWTQLGRVSQALGKSDEAVACYERAAALRPDDPDPLNELGTLRLQRGWSG